MAKNAQSGRSRSAPFAETHPTIRSSAVHFLALAMAQAEAEAKRRRKIPRPRRLPKNTKDTGPEDVS